MKNKFSLSVIILLLSLLFVACGSNAAEDVETTEGTSEVDKEDAEESDDRIVSTTVAITEFMNALELDLVGIPTSYKELPERYSEAEEVGNPMGPDMEIVMSLQPTEVLSVSTLKEDLQSDFEQNNVPIRFMDLESVDGMFAEIEQLGEQYDREEQAQQLVDNFEDKMAEIEGKVSKQDTPKVLILMGIPGSYIVGTENSYIGDLVVRAGGVNAVEDHEEDYISANTEYLQQLEPDVILRAAHGAPEEVVKMFDKEFKENDIWKHFEAVKNDRVYDLEETLFGTTANLAADQALEELITILHPDLQ